MIFSKTAVFLASAAILSLPVFAGTPAKKVKCKVSEYGQRYKSDDGALTIEVALCDGDNSESLQNAIIQITGAPAHAEGIDKQVIYYRAAHAGTGFDFIWDHDGKEFHRLMTRDSGWGSWKYLDAYVNNQNYHLLQDSKDKTKVDTKKLLKAYLAAK